MHTNDTRNPRFTTKAGLPTPYSLACGAVQIHTLEGRGTVKLYQDGCYQVKAYLDGERLFWDSFKKLSDARRRFVQGKKELIVAAVTARLDQQPN